MSVRISARAKRAQLSAFLDTLGNAWLLLCAGDRPPTLDAMPAEDRIVARLFLMREQFRPDAEEMSVAIGPVETLVERAGTVRWFALVGGAPSYMAADGVAGTVSSADLVMTRTELIQGDKVTVDVLAIRLTA